MTSRSLFASRNNPDRPGTVAVKCRVSGSCSMTTRYFTSMSRAGRILSVSRKGYAKLPSASGQDTARLGRIGERELALRCTLSRLLDRRPHEVPPLRPGAVVVPDVRVSEEVLQDEPRVRRPLADSTIGDAPCFQAMNPMIALIFLRSA